MKALLDVNFLVALAWETHQFHSAARHWLEKHESHGWATCAITQLGFIRISSQSSIFGVNAKTPEQVRLLLHHYTANRHHSFFATLPSPSECPEFSKISGPNKVTGVYLIAVARQHHALFVTFDRHLAQLSTPKSPVEIVDPSGH